MAVMNRSPWRTSARAGSAAASATPKPRAARGILMIALLVSAATTPSPTSRQSAPRRGIWFAQRPPQEARRAPDVACRIGQKAKDRPCRPVDSRRQLTQGKGTDHEGTAVMPADPIYLSYDR